jgi:hypothetical protein
MRATETIRSIATLQQNPIQNDVVMMNKENGRQVEGVKITV